MHWCKYVWFVGIVILLSVAVKHPLISRRNALFLKEKQTKQNKQKTNRKEHSLHSLQFIPVPAVYGLFFLPKLSEASMFFPWMPLSVKKEVGLLLIDQLSLWWEWKLIPYYEWRRSGFNGLTWPDSHLFRVLSETLTLRCHPNQLKLLVGD